MDSSQQLLKELTEAHGLPGYETPVREIVVQHLSPLGDLSYDKLGSVICRKKGGADSPRIMVAGHLDEIGFMVKHITKEGFIKFLPLGGWFDQVLLGQRVIIKTREADVVGVIGAKPIHLIPAKKREIVIQKKDMFIDIGATSKMEVETAGIRIGDPIIPRADFVEMTNGKAYLSKAFDDRVGVAVMIEALQVINDKDHPNTVYGTATVQEEVGIRGAQTSAWVVDPDIAIILESDIAGDVPGIEAEVSSVKLGGGPTVLAYDGRMIPNLNLRDYLIDTAGDMGIPIQISYIQGGGTDGGAIHLHKTGVPTVVLGIPARHIHSHSSIIHRDDYDNAVTLLSELLLRLDENAVGALTK